MPFSFNLHWVFSAYIFVGTIHITKTIRDELLASRLVAVALQLLARLHWAMDQLRPLPAFHHSKIPTFVFSGLKDCPRVFGREKGIRDSLKRPYRPTYEVMGCKEKTFKTKVCGQLITVAIDRVDPLTSW